MYIQNEIERYERKIKMCFGMMESMAHSIISYSQNADDCLKRDGSQDDIALRANIRKIYHISASHGETYRRINDYRDKIRELRSQLEAA